MCHYQVYLTLLEVAGNNNLFQLDTKCYKSFKDTFIVASYWLFHHYLSLKIPYSFCKRASARRYLT